jgi:hypothetical protein
LGLTIRTILRHLIVDGAAFCAESGHLRSEISGSTLNKSSCGPDPEIAFQQPAVIVVYIFPIAASPPITKPKIK